MFFLLSRKFCENERKTTNETCVERKAFKYAYKLSIKCFDNKQHINSQQYNEVLLNQYRDEESDNIDKAINLFEFVETDNFKKYQETVQ